jgi:hypothetical protein
MSMILTIAAIAAAVIMVALTVAGLILHEPSEDDWMDE